MVEKFLALRKIFYDILRTEHDGNGADIKANQQMGVNLAPSMQGKSIVIYQNQSIDQKRITNHVIDGLQILDDIAFANPELPIKEYSHPLLQISNGEEPRRLELRQPIEDEVKDDPIEACCQFFVSECLTWRQIVRMIKPRWLQVVVEKYGSQAEAARCLGLSRKYISAELIKLTGEYESPKRGHKRYP